MSGFGYWSGRDVRVEFRPASIDSGVTFVRTDIGPQARIPALVKHRVESPRRTNLRVGQASVEMIEHIMAALSGLQIDNCEVWVDAPEMPGLDGSAQPFVEALDTAGVVTQDAPRLQLRVLETIRVGDENSWLEARPAPRSGWSGGGMTLKFRIDYPEHRAIGRQTLGVSLSPNSFRRELAPCRTFALKQEADWLRAQGLAKRVTMEHLLVYGENGPIDNELRFIDECVRHKALDLVGDLALSGCDVVGHFVAHCSGHRLNSEMVKALLVEGELVGAHRRSA